MLAKDKQRASVIVHRVEPLEEGEKLKIFLRDNYGISTRLLNKIKKGRQIMINGRYAKYHHILKEGEEITIDMKENPNDYEAIPMDLDIVYEDLDLMIINKPPGIVVHPTKGTRGPTLINGIVGKFIDQDLSMKVRFVNRLDMDTSGLLIVAKNPFAHFDMMKQMKEGDVEKKYLTWVHGNVKNDHGVIDQPIYNPENSQGRRIIHEKGQISKTGYMVLERLKERTLMEVRLFTGRTHQIRVHLASIGHPIIGDSLYGEGTDGFPRQALHAYSLEFYQPRSVMRS